MWPGSWLPLAKLPLKGPVAHHSSTATVDASSADVRIDDLSGVPSTPPGGFGESRSVQSPEWLQKKLQSVGLRSINNVVNITNFVLFEMGQPLHAFDLAQLNGGIVVRNAVAGETFQALDGKAYPLAAGIS